jgi:hypothetical protein
MNVLLDIGLSTYDIKPSAEEKAFLEEKRKSTCDVCGTPNHGLDYYPLCDDGAWYNVCSLCHFTRNLDRIPSVEKGSIAFLPSMTQQELSVFLRIYWSVEFIVSRTKVSIEEKELKNSLSVIQTLIEQRKKKAGIYFAIGIQTVDATIGFLNLLPPEKYKLRDRLYRDLRWIPDKSAFEKEIAWWSSEVFNIVESGSIRNNIESFINKLDKKE